MITPKQEKVIEEILRNFDFKKVRKVMKHLDWQWVTTGGVPTKKELRQAALKHPETVADKSNGTKLSASGGFFARRHKNGVLYLAFEVHGWAAAAPKHEQGE